MLISVLITNSLLAADDPGPRRCSFAGKVYSIGQVLFLNNKIFQCSKVYGDTILPLYYWIRLVEEEDRLRQEQKLEDARQRGQVIVPATQ